MTRWAPSTRTTLRIAGACGIASAVVAVCLETLAIYYSPVTFSFTQNWLIDIGGMSYTAFFNVARPEVSSPTTILLCLSGLIVAGILAIIFAIGLFYQAYSPLWRLGAIFAIMGAAALCAMGIFPEPAGVVHIVAAYAFGLLVPTAMLLIGGALVPPEKWSGGFSITLGIVALAGTSMMSYGRSIPEFVLLFAVSLWAIAFGVRMLRSG